MKKLIIIMLFVLGISVVYAGYFDDLDDFVRRENEIFQLQAVTLQHPDNVLLLNKTAGALFNAGRYAEAEVFYQRTLAILEKDLDKSNKRKDEVGSALHSLAQTNTRLGKYESLYLKGLAEVNLGSVLHSLARTYTHLGKYEQAESSYLKGLAINEKNLGSSHPNIASDLYPSWTGYVPRP